jgi:paraquat-inducible protein B
MENTITVRRANVILDISPDDKKKYLDMGYVVINANTGEILEESISNDVATLQANVVELKGKLAKAESVIEDLTAKLKAKDKEKQSKSKSTT